MHDPTPPADPSRRRLLHQAGTGLMLASAATLLPLQPAYAVAPAPSGAASLARTRSGRVAGQRENGVHVFRGIRYGADTAPTRFQPPRLPDPWRGVRDALAYGASAPQGGGEGPGSEDCLFLNVWTPGLRDGARRPVLVYIHGGAFSTGSGSDPLYDGAALCRLGDVVVVTLNHRLNLLGYLYLARHGLAHPGGDALVDPGLADSGNAGQLDLVQALQWVQAHAGEFGGDPGNVTVFGQSGGGAKIATLMAMPAARGLFHRAWTMSGQQVTAAGPRAASQRAALVLEHFNADAQALRTLPLPRLLEALKIRDPSRVESTALYLGPVLDGRSLPRHPFWPDAPPQSAGIPMVIGNTRDETRAFLRNPTDQTLDWEQLPARLDREQFVDLDPAQVIAEYRRLYPHYTPSDVFFAATTAGRSWRGAVEELEARARQGAPTWAYQLDWPSPIEDGRLRAFHTLDIPLVFSTTAVPDSPSGDGMQARALADTMSRALLAFARGGDPNGDGVPAWERYDLERRCTMLFDVHSRAEDDPRGGERRLYQTVPFLQRGTS